MHVWESELDGMTKEDQKWMIGRIVSSITVDKQKGVVSLVLRTIPTVDPVLAKAYEDMEKTKKAPDDRMPFRRMLVAGAGLEPAAFGL